MIINYFDTSAINYLTDILPWDLANKLRERDLKRNIHNSISPIGIWELLLNTDQKRREKIIFFCQNYFSPRLLKTPTEILISYLQNDCPFKDRVLMHNNLFSELDIAKTWEVLCEDNTKTFVFDFENLKERTEPLRMLSKKIEIIISNMTNKSYEKYDIDYFNEVFARLQKEQKLKNDIDSEKIYKINLILIFFLLGIGIDLDNSKLRDYWANPDNSLDPLERFEFIINNNPKIVFRGPTMEMSFMIYTQIVKLKKKSRGIVHDSLHTIYSYYADNLITNDNDFRELRESAKHPAFQQIILIDEIKEQIIKLYGS